MINSSNSLLLLLFWKFLTQKYKMLYLALQEKFNYSMEGLLYNS